jgi:Mn2+/Fe2+ NRAMP family transporter
MRSLLTLEAKTFYATVVVATPAGIGINVSSLDPVKALFWSAVITGVVAVPVMAIMMLISSNQKKMGRFRVRGAAGLSVGLPRSQWLPWPLEWQLPQCDRILKTGMLIIRRCLRSARATNRPPHAFEIANQ